MLKKNSNKMHQNKEEFPQAVLLELLDELLFFFAVVQTLDKRNNPEEFILAHSPRVQASSWWCVRARLTLCLQSTNREMNAGAQSDSFSPFVYYFGNYY